MKLEKRAKTETTCQGHSKVNISLRISFEFKVVVHLNCLTPRYGINKEYYPTVFKRLRDLYVADGQNCVQQLNDDNAPSHQARLVLDILAKHQANTIKQQPYSLDLDHVTFCSFQNPNYIFWREDLSVWMQ